MPLKRYSRDPVRSTQRSRTTPPHRTRFEVDEEDFFQRDTSRVIVVFDREGYRSGPLKKCLPAKNTERDVARTGSSSHHLCRRPRVRGAASQDEQYYSTDERVKGRREDVRSGHQARDRKYVARTHSPRRIHRRRAASRPPSPELFGNDGTSLVSDGIATRQSVRTPPSDTPDMLMKKRGTFRSLSHSESFLSLVPGATMVATTVSNVHGTRSISSCASTCLPKVDCTTPMRGPSFGISLSSDDQRARSRSLFGSGSYHGVSSVPQSESSFSNPPVLQGSTSRAIVERYADPIAEARSVTDFSDAIVTHKCTATGRDFNEIAENGSIQLMMTRVFPHSGDAEGDMALKMTKNGQWINCNLKWSKELRRELQGKKMLLILDQDKVDGVFDRFVHVDGELLKVSTRLNFDVMRYIISKQIQFSILMKEIA